MKKRKNKIWQGIKNVGKALSETYWKINNSNYVQGLKAKENQSDPNAFMPKELIKEEKPSEIKKEEKKEKSPWQTDFSEENPFATKL